MICTEHIIISLAATQSSIFSAMKVHLSELKHDNFRVTLLPCKRCPIIYISSCSSLNIRWFFKDKVMWVCLTFRCSVSIEIISNHEILSLNVFHWHGPKKTIWNRICPLNVFFHGQKQWEIISSVLLVYKMENLNQNEVNN